MQSLRGKWGAPHCCWRGELRSTLQVERVVGRSVQVQRSNMHEKSCTTMCTCAGCVHAQHGRDWSGRRLKSYTLSFVMCALVQLAHKLWSGSVCTQAVCLVKQMSTHLACSCVECATQAAYSCVLHICMSSEGTLLPDISCPLHGVHAVRRDTSDVCGV